MKDSPRHIVFIDYLRGIAILWVFLYHCLIAATGVHGLPWNWLSRSFQVPWWIFVTLPFQYGSIGVPIFFVVSGFCIHLSFEQQGRDWKSFFLRRFFRIYPAYFVAVLIFAYLYTNILYSYDAQYSGRHFWLQFGLHALLVHNFNSNTFLTLGGAFWSLAIEAQLYLLYPLLVLLVGKWGWKRTLICLAACEILLPLWGDLDGFITVHMGATFGLTPLRLLMRVGWFEHYYLEPSPLAYWFTWSLGALAADAYLKGRQMPLAKTSTSFWVFLVVISYFLSPLWTHIFTITALLTTKVIANSLSGKSPRTEAPVFWLKHLQLIGVWSYSLYLLHAPLLEMLSILQQHCLPGIHPFFGFLCFVSTWLIIFPLAGLWYRVFERPGIALGKNIIRKMAVNQPAIPVKESEG